MSRHGLLNDEDRAMAVGFLQEAMPEQRRSGRKSPTAGTRMTQSRNDDGTFGPIVRIVDDAPFADNAERRARNERARIRLGPESRRIEQELTILKNRFELDDSDELEVLHHAHQFDGDKAAIFTAFAYLSRANDLDHYVTDLAELLQVDVDAIDQAIDQAIDAGHLPDYDDLDGPDDDAQADDDDDEPLTAEELIEHYGGSDEDVQTLLAYMDQQGLDDAEDALEQLAAQQGLDLDQLERAAAGGSGNDDASSQDADGNGQPGTAGADD